MRIRHDAEPEICGAIAGNVCDWTRMIAVGVREEDSLQQRRRALASDLAKAQAIGSQLDALGRLPDTGAIVEEATRRARAARARERLIALLRRVRRDPLIPLDISISGVRAEAQRQRSSIRRSTERLLQAVARIDGRLAEIRQDRRRIERDLARAEEAARANGCDLRRIRRFCG